MRIAHFSDLHLLALDGVSPLRFANKRLSGWLNLRYKRGHVHRAGYVRAIAREIARLGVDHVVVTGDFTNLALEPEFALARELIERDLGLEASRVTVTPGNHDVYTRGALTSRRFASFLGDWMKSDLPALAVDTHGAAFPIVRLYPSVAIIALSSAVPRLPFVAAGEIGDRQLEALRRVLAHPEVARRVVVLALHHPAMQPWPRAKAYLEGLRDAPRLLEAIRAVPRGLILHGHLHRRVLRVVPTDAGRLLQIGATSASLDHPSVERMAGFNLYDLDDGAEPRVGAWMYVPASDRFVAESVPKHG